MYDKNKTRFYNDSIIASFTDAEKTELFADIMDMYFRKNFGSISKADFETYLFSFYIEHLLDTGEDFDDYTIGRDLGITQTRVRSLKERKELKYPRFEYDWKSEFLKYAENAKYDDVKKLIKFPIPDVNVIKDARAFFEKNNCYDEFQLNPKLFQCPLDTFFYMGSMIASELGEEFDFELENSSDILEKKEYVARDKSIIKKILSETTSEGIKELLVNGSKELILDLMKDVVPCGNTASSIVRIITNTLKR